MSRKLYNIYTVYIYADVSKYVYCFFVMIMMHIFRLYIQYQRIPCAGSSDHNAARLVNDVRQYIGSLLGGGDLVNGGSAWERLGASCGIKWLF